jgi:hypothetical protein
MVSVHQRRSSNEITRGTLLPRLFSDSAPLVTFSPLWRVAPVPLPVDILGFLLASASAFFLSFLCLSSSAIKSPISFRVTRSIPCWKASRHQAPVVILLARRLRVTVSSSLLMSPSWHFLIIKSFPSSEFPCKSILVVSRWPVGPFLYSYLKVLAYELGKSL